MHQQWTMAKIMEQQKNGSTIWNDNRKVLLVAAGLGAVLIGRKIVQHLREIDLRGQVVLITGGSRGLGFLLAREFAREGCRLVICARKEEELKRAQEDLEREGAKVLAIKCDVSDRLEVERLVDRATGHFGRIDILVNNAGIIQVGPIGIMTVQDFENALNVMFWGVLYHIFAVLPQMLKRRSGRIVNITSIGGKVSVPHLIPYNCAKFAAVALSEGLRAELAREGINVTTIAPGLMRTGSHLNALFKGDQEGEFTWFSLGASLPFVSMDAERAARQIVKATKRGESERILSLPANILALFHGLFPGAIADILGLVNSILPGASGDRVDISRGMDIQERIQSRFLNTLTSLGLSAARRFNQYSECTNKAEA